MHRPTISLWQPHASLIRVGAKLYETRGWACPERYVGQRVFIHAAKKMLPARDTPTELHGICMDKFGFDWRDTLPRGAIVCEATLTGCYRTEDVGPIDELEEAVGDWSRGRFVWRLQDVEALLPHPVTGRQGWFEATVPQHIYESRVPVAQRHAGA